jgi:hypothetical protein
MRMEKQKRTDTFETSDFWLAGALLAAGSTLLQLTWSGTRASFHFSDSAACSERENAYWSGSLRVVAKDFSDALRTLKDRLHHVPRSSKRFSSPR